MKLYIPIQKTKNTYLFILIHPLELTSTCFSLFIQKINSFCHLHHIFFNLIKSQICCTLHSKYCPLVLTRINLLYNTDLKLKEYYFILVLNSLHFCYQFNHYFQLFLFNYFTKTFYTSILIYDTAYCSLIIFFYLKYNNFNIIQIIINLEN